MSEKISLDSSDENGKNVGYENTARKHVQTYSTTHSGEKNPSISILKNHFLYLLYYK